MLEFYDSKYIVVCLYHNTVRAWRVDFFLSTFIFQVRIISLQIMIEIKGVKKI